MSQRSHTVCHVCNEEGHFASTCPKSPSQKKPPRCQIPLGKSIYVVASEFKNQVYIHVRYYDEEKLFPTQKGIGLTLRRWNELKLALPHILENVGKYDSGNEDVFYRHHLGGNVYVSITQGFPRVDLRKFWIPEGASDVCPTRKGISLGFQEFKALVETVPVVDGYVPELHAVVPCWSEDDHQNQIGALRCQECNPNDCQNW